MYNSKNIKQALEVYGVKSVLTQNAKMKRSSDQGMHLYNFGIPAFKSQTGLLTCPNAKQCAVGCYATTGTYKFKASVQAYENRLKLTQGSDFFDIMVYSIDRLLEKHKNNLNLLLIRVHDSGDFYSPEYQKLWYSIADHYKNNSKIQFYAYTKMVDQTKQLSTIKPSNFRIIYSYGGKQDNLIDTTKEHHSKVFESLDALFKSGYIDGTHDDTVAALSTEVKIGLVYHGVKSYKNTAWSKVN